MEPDTSYIIPHVDKDLIRAELKRKLFLRKTNAGNKEIYVTTAHLSPNIMKEIGRLRELSYLLEGGGTGQPYDIDEFDTLPEPYCFKQLFVWDPAEEEIVGGYRFIHGSNVLVENGIYRTPAATEFEYSEQFVKEFLPYTVELGRAFVQPEYQPSNNLRKGLYSLDNLWDGLGVIAMEIPETHYFFGKITMYPQMNHRAKDMILHFYKKNFPDPDGLMRPRDPLECETDLMELTELFNGQNYKEDYQILQKNVHNLGTQVPALITAYMNLSASMRCFGTCKNPDFGNTDETGIMVTLKDIIPEKRARYLESYTIKNRRFDRLRLFKINMKNLPWWKEKINEQEREDLRTLRRLNRIRRREERLEDKQHRLEKKLKR